MLSDRAPRFRSLLRRFASGLTAVLCAIPAEGQAQTPARDPSPHSDVVLVSEQSSVRAGSTTTVAVRLTLDPRWHTYWINPGDAGLPLKVKWTVPEGVTISALHFPTPRLTPQPPLMSYGYEDEVFVLADVSVPAGFNAPSLTITGKADWLACAEVCLPATGPLSLTLPMGGGEPSPTTWAPAIARTRVSVPLPLDGYVAQAWADSTRYVLTLVRNAVAKPVTFTAPYFFADSAGVLDHAAPQLLRQSGDTLVLALPRVAGDTITRTRLSGILGTDVASPAPTSVTLAVDIARASKSDALRTASRALLTSATPVGGVSASAPVAAVDAAGADMTLVAALLFAFIGGLLLNLMPCVFPVLSVKVLALLQHGGGADLSRSRKHGLAFGVGVLVSFWVLAGALLLLRAGGEQLGWGFQLQSPPVVALLALLMFALALNLSGVFEIGMSLTRLGSKGAGGTYADSLLTGVLAVLVAAPCTAPFMGAALGYALVQPAFIGLLVFTALGLGLALPFVVLASEPRLLKFLPKPGPWLETLKQLFAFPLYATVVWLLWVLGQQAGVNAIALALIAMIVFALGAWLWARSVRSDSAPIRAGSVVTMAAATLVMIVASKSVAPSAATVVAGPTTIGAAQWQPWSATVVRDARAAGRPVFVDFTAAWCLSCQVNERVALRTAAVTKAFADGNVALVRADWTSRDDGITQVLAGFGRSGVPLYVLYPADPAAAPVILPAVLTPGMVVDAVTKAAASPPITADSRVR